MKTFEDYLREQFAVESPVLDDDLADSFEVWLSSLDIEEVIDYSDRHTEIIRSNLTNLI